jgi:two-component system, LytTR family, response regulator LytT
MSVRILVVEDESIVRKDIEKNLEKLGYIVVGTADTGEKAIERALEVKPDLILMDIMLKGKLTGIDAAEQIKKTLDVPIIFLTAYADQSTLAKAKITEPHGYILKPFKEVDVHTSIEMAVHKHKKEMAVKEENDFLRSLARFKEQADYVFVKNKGRLVHLKKSDIILVQALKDYVTIITEREKYTIHATMKDIETKLSDRQFMRVHRSFIINMDRITEIENYNLMLQGYHEAVPVGGAYKDMLSDRINLL